ncbi:BCD family MFS transporter [Prochlorothrix hollandica]|uniref:MFS transporter n=1 Tax=Prochlorothrix hollandica PCC 9006 = CALU 1027 TaxID=317619 RepID=A0A0M2PT62_PROHO|nr:BCD family MFS transporter [Prochlorothrix hollandica]KKI99309.1 MFS transporter [Prochlorothrix hollandica PCC 9006 = CALU 1027]
MTSDFASPANTPPNTPIQTPAPVTLPLMFRLGLFNAGLGVMSVLTLGLLNRVMVAELNIPLGVTAGMLALSQITAPAKVWIGQLSDSKPLRGYHRSGYIWLGSLLFCSLVFGIVQLMWRLGDAVAAVGQWQWTGEIMLWSSLLGVTFALYGLAISTASTPFVALLVDITEEDNRSQVIGIAWSMLLVGIIAGGITTAIMLKQVGIEANLATIKASLNYLFALMPLVVLLLVLLGTWGVEKRYSRYAVRSQAVNRDDQLGLTAALRILTATSQTGLFFCCLLLVTLGLFMQDAVLENYGAEVFQMPMADTTQLNAFFGLGNLVGLSGAGFWIVPRFGKLRTVRIGCVLVATTLLLLISVGLNPQPPLLKAMVGCFGLASGITTNGSLSLMLDFTAAETAGTFIGAWGLAQSLARAGATWLGGLLQSLGSVISDDGLVSYGLVFAVEAGVILGAIVVLNQVNVHEFQTKTRAAISQILETDLD